MRDLLKTLTLSLVLAPANPNHCGCVAADSSTAISELSLLELPRSWRDPAVLLQLSSRSAYPSAARSV